MNPARELAEAVSLWQRLGILTLGDLVSLPKEAVAARFGKLGVWAGRLAAGDDIRPPSSRRFVEDVQVSEAIEPPAFLVESALQVGRRLAYRFSDEMSARSLACGKIAIAAVTEHGVRSRIWRTDDGAIGGMEPSELIRRLRWQLDGWLTESALASQDDDFGKPAPVLQLEITALEVVDASDYQSGLWGADSGTDRRAERALSHVQGLLGTSAVESLMLQGGRCPHERQIKFSFGDVPPTISPLDAPWPGQIPDPAPSYVLKTSVPAKLLDKNELTVKVDERISAFNLAPVKLVFGSTALDIIDYAGPWILPRRWWEIGDNCFSQSYCQVVTCQGEAFLLNFNESGCEVVGVYS
jgi:protein ImuB